MFNLQMLCSRRSFSQSLRSFSFKKAMTPLSIIPISRKMSSVSVPPSPDAIAASLDSSLPLHEQVLTAIPDIHDAVTAVVVQQPQLTNSASHLVMSLVDNIHSLFGIPYWEAIVATTVLVRLLLVPINIKTIQSSARMACLRPHMQKLQDAMRADLMIDDMRTKSKYQEEMKALFTKYKVNPLRSVILPFVQLPIFFSFFFALRDMGTYFPGMASGGTMWFMNLSAPDPLLVLPLCNALSFLVMLEVGMDGMPAQQADTFKWVMRGLSIVMVPLTMDLPQALFVYWNTNNVWSIAQVMVLKQPGVRTYFDIPQPPAPEESPPMKLKNPMANIVEMMQRERASDASAKAEIVDGVAPPPPPPVGRKPSVTFSAPPSLRKP